MKRSLMSAMSFLFVIWGTLLLNQSFAADNESLKKGSVCFGNDPAHTGIYDSAPVDTAAKILWKFQTQSAMSGSPVIYDGRIYFGSGETLYAVDREGKEVFRFKADGDIDCTPAVSASGVVFQTGEGMLYSLNIKTGSLNWSRHLFAPTYLKLYDFWDYYLSSPVIAGNAVYVGASDGYLYAVRADNGEELWKFKSGNIIRSTPSFSSGKIYFGGFDGVFYALNADNGGVIWKYQMKEKNYSRRGEIQGSAAVIDGTVYFGSRNANMYALDASTGTEKWIYKHDNGSWMIASPAVYKNIVLAGSSDAHFFNAVDKNTGKEIWRFLTQKNVFSSAGVAGNVVYFGEGNAYSFFEESVFHALDISTGKETWNLKFPAQVWSSPAIADGVIYITCMDGCLYAVK
ncbi:MAG: PQQ-binding-like beta-propeller repeat protein [Bacteroidota bacterium]